MHIVKLQSSTKHPVSIWTVRRVIPMTTNTAKSYLTFSADKDGKNFVDPEHFVADPATMTR